MQSENQSREKRIEVARPIEIRDPKSDSSVEGYTKNLSDGGVRAWMDQTFKAGQILELNMVLENDRDPVKTHGEVVWCSSEIYGDGAEVGLKFVEYKEENGPEASKLGAQTGDQRSSLIQGCSVTLLAGDQSLSAVIEEVTEVDEETGEPLRVNLKIHTTDKGTLHIETDEEILASVEDWKADPVRDAKKWFERYVRPVIEVLKKVLVPSVFFLGRMGKKLWKKVPIRPRVRIESLYSRLRIGYRLSLLKQVCLSAKTFACKFVR